MGDVGGYELHLYCDGTGPHTPGDFPHIYTDNTTKCKAACYKAARADGWTINCKFDRAYCPECANRRKPKWQQK